MDQYPCCFRTPSTRESFLWRLESHPPEPAHLLEASAADKTPISEPSFVQFRADVLVRRSVFQQGRRSQACLCVAHRRSPAQTDQPLEVLEGALRIDKDGIILIVNSVITMAGMSSRGVPYFGTKANVLIRLRTRVTIQNVNYHVTRDLRTL